MDSATLLAFSLARGDEVFPVFFDYGSKHGRYEKEAALKLVGHYRLEGKIVKLPFIGELFKSNLLISGGEIPEGHYESESMKLTVVPGRNVIFISILMGYAWSIGAEVIMVGVHGGDHVIYEDCRAGFIAAMNSAVIQGSGNRVHLESPFQYLNKTEILKIGLSMSPPVPYHLTRTCYKNQPLSCGVCGSCQERLEAFRKVGGKDLISYQ